MNRQWSIQRRHEMLAVMICFVAGLVVVTALVMLASYFIHSAGLFLLR